MPFLPKRDFQCAVEAFFRHPDQLVLGSETAKQACERFTASIENVIKTGQKDNIVVAHGTVISLFAANVAKVHPIDLWAPVGSTLICGIDSAVYEYPSNRQKRDSARSRRLRLIPCRLWPDFCCDTAHSAPLKSRAARP